MLLENLEYAQLVGKPKATGKVWTHFGLPIDATGTVIDKKRTIGRLCKVNIAYLGNTLNLTYHLRQVHPHHMA